MPGSGRRAHLFPGMAFPVHLLQVRELDLRVDLRGLHRGMAQKLLDVPQISLPLQQVGGAGVPEAVRGDVLGDLCFLEILSYDPDEV